MQVVSLKSKGLERPVGKKNNYQKGKPGRARRRTLAKRAAKRERGRG